MGRTQDFLPNPGKRGAFYNGMVVALQVRKMGPIRNAGPRSSERCRRLAKSAASRQPARHGCVIVAVADHVATRGRKWARSWDVGPRGSERPPPVVQDCGKAIAAAS